MRMCANCVQDLEQFNRSLRNKANLLNGDMERRGSFAEYEASGNGKQEKAPRNRKDSFDSADEMDQVTIFKLNSLRQIIL